MFNAEKYNNILQELQPYKAVLVAVSKFKAVEDIMQAYTAGQRDFGENYVQELAEKVQRLPEDIRWHFIGHLQTNKVKYIAPFIYLIQGVDSLKLLTEINKQAIKNNRVIKCLLQVHIAKEQTKFGFDSSELDSLIPADFPGVEFAGLMGMASLDDNNEKVRGEFQLLKALFEKLKANFPSMNILSMGMSDDYKLAMNEGSNMVRIGSLLFGRRS